MPTSLAEERGRSAALRVDGLHAGYGRTPIITDVNLTVDRSEIVAVIGPNGAGKSTLLKAITGLTTKMGGRIWLDDRDISDTRPELIARLGIGYVPQVRDVFVPLTVKENLEMGAYATDRRDVRSRIGATLELFPALAPMLSRRAGNLSGGERKMLAIARVMMTRPRVLILDEPTANLSPQLANQVLVEQVPPLASAGVAVLLVEQRAADALAVATWGYVMTAGRVTISQAAADLRARSDIAAMFLGGAALDTGVGPLK
jgi:ABC-type branched-subunit amino acid transport system ATPase component